MDDLCRPGLRPDRPAARAPRVTMGGGLIRATACRWVMRAVGITGTSAALSFNTFESFAAARPHIFSRAGWQPAPGVRRAPRSPSSPTTNGNDEALIWAPAVSTRAWALRRRDGAGAGGARAGAHHTPTGACAAAGLTLARLASRHVLRVRPGRSTAPADLERIALCSAARGARPWAAPTARSCWRASTPKSCAAPTWPADLIVVGAARYR